VVHFRTADQLREDVRSDMTAIADSRADELDVWLSSVGTSAKVTSDHPTLRSGTVPQVRSHLTGLVESEKVPEGVVALHYYDTEAGRIVTSSAEPMVGVSPAEQGAPFARDPPTFESPNEVYVSDPFRVPVVDFPVIAVVSPIADRPGKAVIYMINLEQRMQSFANVVEGGETLVVNSDGKYVSHPDPGRILAPYDSAIEREGSVGAGEASFSDTDETVSAYAPMESTDWTVLVNAPTAKAYALGSSITSSIVGLILLAVISLALIGATIGSSTTISLR
jgi:methyl-accepting chemotaxis protein